MADPLDGLHEEERGLLTRTAMPGSARPMLATLAGDAFSDPDWIYERKLDGMRCIVFRDGRGARLRSRNDKGLDGSFPELCDVVEQATELRVVADGEIVAFRGGVTSFERLQRRIGLRAGEAGAAGVKVYLYLFDLLYLEGNDTTALPVRARKRVLRRAFRWRDPLRWTPHRNGSGEEFHSQACRKGWEGVVAKRASGTYVHGRSRDWLKLKCTARQEFVIGGYTEPEGSRKGFGAVLLGYHESGRLRYAGKVGTGFDDAQLQALHGRLLELERKTPPFEPAPDDRDGTGAHWVTPRLVAEVAFTEWTDGGRLRHPRFLGLRPDASPRRVRREAPVR